ncbi:MAG: PKD domain-containing protein [Candidatus Paceibacterota bacterium]
MKKIIFISLLVFLSNFSILLAETSQFVFSTDPQTIKPGEISGTITVQSQNSSGISEPISETNDLIFTSTSGTGEFLNSSGNPVSTTMSKNTSNRTFYYRDSSEGSFTLTVKATGRDSQKSFTATQNITISSTAVVVEETNDGDSTESDSETDSSVDTSSSAHSSPAPLNSTKEKVSFEVSAGRDRLATVGNSIAFKAVPVKSTGIDSSNISYGWSFGDGSTGTGISPSHSYEFPGEYIVVLNAGISDYQGVSRLKVKVVAPVVSISKIDGGLEVYQTSGAEINLGDWYLKSGVKQFIIPKDTLLPTGKKIIFSDKLTGLYSAKIELYNPLGQLFAEYGMEANLEDKPSSFISEPQDLSLSDVEREVNKIQLALNEISPQVVTQSIVAYAPPPVLTPSKSQTPQTPPAPKSVLSNIPAPVFSPSSTTPENLVANSFEVFVAPEEKGMVSKIFSWPMKGFSFVKGVLGI